MVIVGYKSMEFKYNEAWQKWVDKCGESEPDIDSSFASGWNSCMEEVLKVMEKYKDSCCSYVAEIEFEIKELK